jgi:hypothetical protein
MSSFAPSGLNRKTLPEFWEMRRAVVGRLWPGARRVLAPVLGDSRGVICAVVALDPGQGAGFGFQFPVDAHGRPGELDEAGSASRGLPATAFSALAICLVDAAQAAGAVGFVLVVDALVAAPGLGGGPGLGEDVPAGQGGQLHQDALTANDDYVDAIRSPRYAVVGASGNGMTTRNVRILGRRDEVAHAISPRALVRSPSC